MGVDAKQAEDRRGDSQKVKLFGIYCPDSPPWTPMGPKFKKKNPLSV